MPLFVTLRADGGAPLATAMLPPQAQEQPGFRIVIVGPENGDPYIAQGRAIEALARHVHLNLPRETCYPYA
jgi:hypothetical protein